MSEDRSRYIVELVAEEQQFAAGTKKAVADLNKVGEAAAKLDRTRVASLKAQAAAEERMKRFNRLSDTQKLVVLEERRVNLAKQLAYAEGRGNARQAGIIRGRLAGIDEMAAGVGAGARAGGRGIRGDSPVARLAGAGLTSLGLSGLGGVAGPLGAAMVAIVAIGRTINAVFSEAFERSKTAQAALDANKKVLEVSEGATEGLASVGVALGTLWAGIKKILGEIWGATANLGQGAVGMGASALGSAAKGVGLTSVGNWLSGHGERMMGESVGNRPEWMGGLGGVGAQGGAQADAKRAELDAAKIKKDKKEEISLAKEEAKEKERVRKEELRLAASRQRDAANEKIQALKADMSSVSGLFGNMRSGANSGMYAVAGQVGMDQKMFNVQRQMLEELRAEVRETKRLSEVIRESGGI